MRLLNCVLVEHDLWLVGLAAALCLFGSVITIRLFQRLAQAERGARAAWAFLGALAGGATIWCTHFVSMLAYRPGVGVAYEPALTATSLGVAILGGGLALAVGARNFPFAAAVGGGLLGLAIVAMHYTGMAAFTAAAFLHWSSPYVAASVAGSILFSAAAFHLARRRPAAPGPAAQRRVAAAAVVLMATGIVVLHFTGMAAVTITPYAPAHGALTGGDAETGLALAIAAAGLMVMGAGVSSHALDFQLRARARDEFDSLMEGSVDGMAAEQNGRIVAANPALVALLAPYEGAAYGSAVIGQPFARWAPNLVAPAAGGIVQAALLRDDGASIPVEIAIRQHDVAGDAPLTIFAVRDLRARLAQERRIAHLARNDVLTGLPNRASFLEWITRKTTADATVGRLALLAIDFDRFKEVNDIHGHAAGDQLLVRITERMRAALKPDEFLARLGGDEFVALAPVYERIDALDLAGRLRAAVTAPVDLGHAQVACGVSIGVAIWPDDAQDDTALINNADLAMYRAKASLTADICFYEAEMDTAVRHRRRMALELREALDQGQFRLNWQVQASIRTGAVTGFEALLRWTRPDGVAISPAEFIPLAEQSGLILPIGEWVLRRACAEAVAWAQPYKVAVNLSPVQLAHTDLPRLVEQILQETGLPPRRLELEITETAMIADVERTTDVLRRLKQLGVSIAMDDFGTGYSSLSTLRAFQFDKIKLDRSFVAELDQGPQSSAIIRAVLALGASLEIPVLAEGIETMAQLNFLRAQGCAEAQGYLLGRPTPEARATLPADTAAAWA